MIILKLTDGLGNQMFQYAFGRQLQSVYRMPMLLETARFRKQTRPLGLHRLNIRLTDGQPDAQHCRFATDAESLYYRSVSRAVMLYAEKVRHIPQSGAEGYRRMAALGHYTTRDSLLYYPLEMTRARTIYARGYFQCEPYFRDVAPEVRRELRVREVSDGICGLGERMQQENSVCVHIRRGDYIGHPKFDVCGAAYYRRSVEYVRAHTDNPVFYVFSNSPKELDWIEREYGFLADAHFVRESKSEFDDLYLMYHCRHHVISNSTFGWWGAYLSDGAGMTLCPDRWTRTGERTDVELDDWIRIPAQEDT